MPKKRAARETTHMPHYDDVRGVTACGRGKNEVKVVDRQTRPNCDHCKKHWDTFEYRYMRRRA